jgi:arylsulfatase
MIIQAVRDAGLEDNTVFVFTSDNGPTFQAEFFNSAAGFRGQKGSLYEGGIHEPCIVAWKGHIAPGSTNGRVCGFEDWLPTFLELAGGKETTPKEIDGVSFAPTLLGQSQPERPFLYREFPAQGGQQSLRIGDWKGIRMNMLPGTGKAKAKQKAGAAPNMKIELYDLKTDPHETKDVAETHPDIVAKIEKLMREQHTPNPDFPFPAIDNL